MTKEEEEYLKKREEHLNSCKERAFKILEKQENPDEAWASFLSDMQKKDSTHKHVGLELGIWLSAMGNLSSVPQMKKFIEEFN